MSPTTTTTATATTNSVSVTASASVQPRRDDAFVAVDGVDDNDDDDIGCGADDALELSL